jgi:uncharacterized protein (DUF2252 family)
MSDTAVAPAVEKSPVAVNDQPSALLVEEPLAVPEEQPEPVADAPVHQITAQASTPAPEQAAARLGKKSASVVNKASNRKTAPPVAAKNTSAKNTSTAPMKKSSVSVRRKSAGPSAPRQHPVPPKAPMAMTYAERYAEGKALRETCPRNSHAAWNAPAGRPDSVELVLSAEKGRIPDLLPLRHGRMVRSAFTFYRGAALTMATDLATTPSTGVRVQCCGDAHLCNFGGFATPERRILFAINDLDETLPAPWEWDVKRLAPSFVVACRDNNLTDRVARDVVLNCVRSYRESMAEFSQMKTLELWYSALWAEDLLETIKDPALRRRAIKRIEKERAKSRAEEMFPKLVGHKGEMPVIKDQLPTIFHADGHTPGEVHAIVLDAMNGYRASLRLSLQSLFDRYELRDAAVKVVGVGSVGTVCFVLLYMAGNHDPLFLQVKEARASVMEPFAGASVHSNHGHRVVHGYHLMQPASDMFLGWTQGQLGRHFFVRQLRDIKISIMVETFGAAEMELYGAWCGRALALSHARSGSSATLSGYMGKSDAFDQAIASFSMAYADQNEKDHAALERAVRSGKVKAVFEQEK